MNPALGTVTVPGVLEPAIGLVVVQGVIDTVTVEPEIDAPPFAVAFVSLPSILKSDNSIRDGCSNNGLFVNSGSVRLLNTKRGANRSTGIMGLRDFVESVGSGLDANDPVTSSRV